MQQRSSHAVAGDSHDSFLAMLLERYHEVLTVRYLARKRLIELTFLADGEIGTGQFMHLRTQLQRAGEAIGALLSIPAGSLRCRRSFVLGYTQLTIQRDLDTLSVEELDVLVGLVRQVLGPRLVVEPLASGEGPSGDVADDEGASPERLAHHLEALKRRRRIHTLIGLRHSGQPLVYDMVTSPASSAGARHR
ncbi:hypothetical protein U7230_06135 [Carboxydochorda subterranea]|uniref:Uncharacterized protein n=1 Tax=Carboxydichorda subterranea TaxID=3109565 RepID=A0ABZ1C0P9_9FIRM|nr:hypothetical protein [Limnochorda sp. L945t]WRP18578.1 hypothetical protein U7230_06135 [Limnochorda sp. L945t]